MGLDGVELVMECEDEFGIRISDAEATEVRTAGDLSRLVIRLLSGSGRLSTKQGCQSARLFNHFRKCLVESGVDRSLIKLACTLDELLPSPGDVRGAAYALRCIGAETRSIRVDSVLRTRNAVVFGLAGSIFLVPFTVLFVGFGWTGFSVVMWVSLFIGVVALLIRQKTRSELVRPEQTVRALLVAMKEHLEDVDFDDAENEIWFRVQIIIAEQLGLSVDQVTPDADFIEDLGLI